ncbi:hypothetical protein EC968_009968 [Mortierella alpina]|nr:hypothetical protein EC968_009968 [Mortierella alpina]
MSDGPHGIEFGDIITGAWNCLGMRELSLTLNRSIDVQATLEAMRKEGLNRAAGDGKLEKNEQYREDDGEQKRRATAWAAKQAFTQIGRLAALKHLVLGADIDPNSSKAEVVESHWDLTLSKGWLAQLAGLKSLRHLHMRTNYWSYMGQAEVEFMDAEWPWLECVTFDKCILWSTRQLLNVITLPHWQWLQRKRPCLRLKAIQI